MPQYNKNYWCETVLCEYHLFTMFSVIHISEYPVHNKEAQHSMQCMDDSIVFLKIVPQDQ